MLSITAGRRFSLHSRILPSRVWHNIRSMSSASSSIGDPFSWDCENHWKDMFGIDKLLTEEERMIRDVARNFAQKSLLPIVTDSFRHEKFDPKIYKQMGELGLLGPTIQGYDCPGASYVAYGLVAKELEVVDSAYRSAYSVQSSLVMHPINIFGSESQKKKWLPVLASGDAIGCFGLTEPNHGSDPSGMETTARRDGNDWILNGSKMWITSSPIADVAIVWAKDSADGKIRGFIVDTATSGVTCPAIDGKFSLRASTTGLIVMEDVRVSHEASFLPKAEGLKGPFSCLNSARLGIAWGVMGAAEACLEAARRYTLDRKQFKRPLASNQTMQIKMAQALTEISLGSWAAFRACQLKGDDDLHSNVISLIKRNNCGKALQIARDCRDMLGANGIIDEFHVIRHMLNLEAVNTYEGTHDIHGLILGRAITGIPAFQG